MVWILQRRITFETDDILDFYIESLDRNDSFDELQKSLDKCKNCKATGVDGIPTEYYKNLPNEWKHFYYFFLRLF